MYFVPEAVALDDCMQDYSGLFTTETYEHTDWKLEDVSNTTYNNLHKLYKLSYNCWLLHRTQEALAT